MPDSVPPSEAPVPPGKYEPRPLALLEEMHVVAARDAATGLQRQLKNLYLLVGRYQAELNDVAVDGSGLGVTCRTGPLDIQLLQTQRAQNIEAAIPKKPAHLTGQLRFAQALHAIAQGRRDWDAQDLPVLFDRYIIQDYERNVLPRLIEQKRVGRFPLMHSQEKTGAAAGGFWGMPQPAATNETPPVPTEGEARSWFTDVTRQLDNIEKTLGLLPVEQRSDILLKGLGHTAHHSLRKTRRAFP